MIKILIMTNNFEEWRIKSYKDFNSNHFLKKLKIRQGQS